MTQPNLLFIFTDEQKLDTLACYGNEQIEMPHLNRFAASACVFEQPYCVQPVCTPSRSTLMTGVLPHKTGAHRNNLPLKRDLPCLPELLTDRDDYATGYHGKWHLGDEVFAQHGFDHWQSIEDEYAKHFS
jgi:arylsulfatase A-like enzyme